MTATAKLLAVEHLTLDGVMQGPARPDEDRRNGFELGGWAAANSDPAMQRDIGARMGGPLSLGVGRTTYEDFANVWPQRAGNPMSDALTQVTKYVATSRPI